MTNYVIISLDLIIKHNLTSYFNSLSTKYIKWCQITSHVRKKNAKEHLWIFDLFPRYSNVRYHSLCLIGGNSSFQYSIIQVVSENNPIDQGINTTIQGIHHSSLESFDPTPPTPCVCFSRQSKSHYYSQKK